MIVYDLEISKYDWLIGIYNGKEFTQIHNDYDQLEAYYNTKKEDIWVGHNSAHYDSILTKCILLRKQPNEIKELSDSIVKEDKGRDIIRRLALDKIQLYDWDIMTDDCYFALKEVEGYFGMEISESSVDFNLDRPWTKEEYEEMALYNRHDLLATWEEALCQIDKMKFRSILLKKYNLPKRMIGYTNAKLTAEILQSNYTKYDDTNNAFDRSIIPLKIDKYTEVIDFFTNPNTEDGKLDYRQKLKVDIAGVPHVFAIGGIHGAIKNFYFDGTLWLIDVASYYPNMMINFNLTPRSMTRPEAFKELVDERIKAKNKVSEAKANGKMDELSEMDKSMPGALKLPINTVSGCMKAKFSKLYDERNNNWMCISGQVLMVDLIEKLEPYCKLVQSNTDGLVIIPLNHKKCDEAIQEWMDRTGLVLEKTVAKKIIQKDVNNYILEDHKGDIKVKGGYVAQYWNDYTYKYWFRRNNEICDQAIVEFLLHDVPLMETLSKPDNILIKYQIVKKLGGMYSDAYHEVNGEMIHLPNRTNRIFAAKDTKYGKVKKKKWDKENLDNVESIPEHCLVVNEDIRGKTLKDMHGEIDLSWYEDICKKRIVDYILTTGEKTKGKKYNAEEDWHNALKKIGKE